MSAHPPKPGDSNSTRNPAEVPGPAIDITSSHDAPTIISKNNSAIGIDRKIMERVSNGQLGPYKLIEAVGAGGMATVLRAIDMQLNRTVALKILPPEMAIDAEHLERFRQEARAAAKLDHENIARVYSIGEDQGLHFIAFEFVEGENLKQRMESQGGRLAIADALPLMIQIAVGLAHAASRGIVHRDIKPSNILITPDGRAKIVDMGLARNLEGRPFDGGLTQSGITLGTFDYISPEQAIDPRRADIRSDIYSLGCTFYHALTGRSPVPEGTAAQKLQFHQNTPPIDPRRINPLISEELTMVLARMMAKDPELRYQHPDPLIQHLLTLADKEKISLSSSKIEALPRTTRYIDPLMPEPPRLSKGWLAAAALLVIGLSTWFMGGFGNGKGPIDNPPFWLTPKEKKSPPIAEVAEFSTNLAPQPNDGPHTANNAEELRKFLKQNISPIRLMPGTTYDLTRLPQPAEPAEPLRFEDKNLVLDAGDGVSPAIVVLDGVARNPEDDSNGNALRLADSVKSIRFRNIRFRWALPIDDTARVGLRFPKLEAFEATYCAFEGISPSAGENDGIPFPRLEFNGDADIPTPIKFDRCYFGPRGTSVLFTGPVSLRCGDCTFAPASAIFRVDANAQFTKPIDLQIRNSTAMMNGGSIIELGDGIPCRFTADQNLFAAVDEKPDSLGVLIRQNGELSPATRFGHAETADSAALGNAYFNVAALQMGGHTLSFAECQERELPFEEGKAIAKIPLPWQQAEPDKKLADPRAFSIQLRLPTLRVAGSPDKVLGADHFLGRMLYDYPLRKPDLNRTSQRIVRPEMDEEEARLAGVYRQIRSAAEDARPGDEILLHWNGPLKPELGQNPIDFDKPDLNLTIKPDEGCTPLLTLPRSRINDALFKMTDGQLHFENLQFRIGSEKSLPESTRSLVSILGGGTCTFKNCLVTLAGPKGLSVVSIADPRDEMMMKTPMEKWLPPRVIAENMVVRGRGKFLHVQASRTFDLDLRETLVALDGSLIVVNHTPLDTSNANPAQVHLDRVTTWLTDPVFDLEAAPRRADMKSIGLVPIQAVATHSLFVPAGQTPAPLVKLQRVDTDIAMRDLFNWRGSRDNFYGYDNAMQTLLERVPENAEMMPTVPIDAEHWQEMFRESGHPFGPVKFLGPLPESGRSTMFVKPLDFRRKGEEAPDAGATLESLPVPLGPVEKQ